MLFLPNSLIINVLGILVRDARWSNGIAESPARYSKTMCFIYYLACIFGIA